MQVTDEQRLLLSAQAHFGNLAMPLSQHDFCLLAFSPAARAALHLLTVSGADQAAGSAEDVRCGGDLHLQAATACCGFKQNVVGTPLRLLGTIPTPATGTPAGCLAITMQARCCKPFDSDAT
jgi:hypothetical protein